MIGNLQKFQCRLNILVVKPVRHVLEIEIVEDESRCCGVSTGPSLEYTNVLFHVCISQARTGSWLIRSYNVIWVETGGMTLNTIYRL
jgi:hypothetical protein